MIIKILFNTNIKIIKKQKNIQTTPTHQPIQTPIFSPSQTHTQMY